MRYKLLLTVYFICALFLTRSNATHIVGGDISVQYSGTPNYFNVTTNFFYDCLNGATTFDNPITIGVYDKVTHALATSFNSYYASNTQLTLGNACYTPNLCISKVVFYTASVYLPNNPNGYYLSYIRCCRNGVIANIFDPGNEGFLAYCEMADPALMNSTPYFNTNPDGFMCRNFMNTDLGFTATDPNGDQLRYYFSTPLSCVPNGQCSSGWPNPGAMAGPYGNITWIAGYSTNNPFGDPAMTINVNSGVINCTPPNTGIYVFCVIVEEWRGGVKIGEIRRDFQFDVLNSCTVANIAVTPGNPTCQGTTTTLTASGVPAGFNYTWYPGGQVTSAIAVGNPTPGTTNYTVSATNGLGCTYTATTAVTINANPTPIVTPSGNPCLGQITTLTASGGTSYSWSNGFLTAAMSTSAPGTYTVWVTNSNGCSATTTGTISGIPVTASTYTWTGAGSTAANNWFDPANWNSGGGSCLPTCAKNVLIPAASSWSNPSNNPDIGTASGAAACSTITINQGGKLSFSAATSQLDICGDFIDHGVTLTFPSNGVLRFIGTVPQNFIKSNTASGNDLNKIILANTATPPTLTVREGVGYKDMSLGSSGTFTFQSGILITEGNRQLVIKNTAANAITGHGTSTYVFGRIKRSVVASTSYDFPVGGNPSGVTVYPYELANINFTSLTGLSNLTVCFDNPDNSTGALTGNGLPLAEQTGQYTTIINNGGPNTGAGFPNSPGTVAGVWTIIPDAGTGVYSLTLYGRNFDNSGAAGAYFSILKRNTFSTCTPIPSWGLDGNVGTNGLSSNVITATRTGMSGFSQFVIAKHSTPLPVELIAFDATCQDQGVLLEWATATEQNNDYFVVEKSCDASLNPFIAIGQVTGSGNSNTIRQYSFVDPDKNSSSCYYRLKQVDFDGKTTEFSPKQANCSNENSFEFIGVLPNPAEDETHLIFSAHSRTMIHLQIKDMTGRTFHEEQIRAEEGLNKVRISLSDLSSGIYFIRLEEKGNVSVKKIVKE